jgi:hypothetical protein
MRISYAWAKSASNVDIRKNSWNTGILEYWNTGILEYWNTGILEYWNTGILG